MNVCPLCLATLPAQPTWMCVSGRCAAPPDAPPGVVGPIRPPEGVEGTPRPVGAGPGVPPDCDRCGGPSVEVCPNPSCRYNLPSRWRETPSTHVVLAGARGSGKSVYIGVLIKQLELLGDLTGMRVTPATARAGTIYREYYEAPLFAQRGILESTRSAEVSDSRLEPLVFDLAPQIGARHHLVISDVAGEDMERTPLDRSRMRAFTIADAVVFLYDPLGLSDVRAALGGIVPPQATGGGVPTVLDNVLGLIGTRRPKVAVAMSKFDVMHAARGVPGTDLGRIMRNAGAAFCREPDRRGTYDDEDGQLLHEEIRSLLHWLHAGSVVNAMGRLTAQQGVDHRFFAVSALGNPPAGRYLHDRGIAPFRCLDPLRWVLEGRAA